MVLGQEAFLERGEASKRRAKRLRGAEVQIHSLKKRCQHGEARFVLAVRVASMNVYN